MARKGRLLDQCCIHNIFHKTEIMSKKNIEYLRKCMIITCINITLTVTLNHDRDF